jgi:hypothetical protein
MMIRNCSLASYFSHGAFAMIRSLLCLALLLSFVVVEPALAQKDAPAKSAAELAAEQTAREEAFGKLMSGATLEGQFTARDRADGKMANDKYTLGKVSKVADSKDTWNFETRIQYGGKDFTVPIAVRVVWSGDTPVITLDKLAIPGAGTFTARVMIFNNQYAGMWDGGGNHGGLMFGKITAATGDDKKTEK